MRTTVETTKYLVNSDGTIYSKHIQRNKKYEVDKHGYLRTIYKCENCGSNRPVSVHIIIYRTFNGISVCSCLNKEKGYLKSDSLVIDHINNDKLDNRLSNLRLITHSANLKKVRGILK